MFLMSMHTVVENFTHPPVMFFFLGMLAIAVRSDLEIPAPIAKFLSIYLLFHIGIKGGEELYHGYYDKINPAIATTSGSNVALVMMTCIIASFVLPFISYRILRLRLDPYNAGAIAATYGSVSAVTFATATTFLQNAGVKFGGYMVAGMALMESPAIIAGLVLIRMATANEGGKKSETGVKEHKWGAVLHEALFNGSVFLLLGSLAIGFFGGQEGEHELKPFVDDIFKGMLCLYMLEMGLLAARRISELRTSGMFLVGFALLYPPIVGCLGIGIAYGLGLIEGDAILLAVLLSSASYIAVPAAMRMSVPQANLSLMLPMALGVTFTFNITLGIPLYYNIIHSIWQ